MMSSKKRIVRAWEWEDGSVGVRGADSVEDALAAVTKDLGLEYVEWLEERTLTVYSVPAAYFRSDWDGPWDMSRVGVLPSVETPAGRGYVKVLWWAA